MSDLNETGNLGDDGNNLPLANDQNITLSREEYSNLVAQMSAMQTKLDIQLNSQTQPQQQQQPQQPQLTEEDLNRLTNTQLLQLMNNQVSSQVSQVMQAVVALSVKEEIKEARGAYEDFDSLKGDIHRIATAQPHLSIDQAYHLAKANKPAGKSTTPPATKETKAPENKNVIPPSSEKGGISPGAVTKNPVLSVREAAMAALKDFKLD